MDQHELVEHESASSGYEAEHDHIVPVSLYLLIFGGLIVGTILTVLVANLDLDEYMFTGANTFMALLIAIAKTALVVLFFMHVRYSGRLVWLSAFGGFFWLLILFAFTMSDYLTRGNGQFR